MKHWSEETRPCLVDKQTGEPFYQREDPDTGVLVFMNPLYGVNWFNERHAKRFLRQIYRAHPGGLFYDVGANHGLFSLGALDMGWDVVAFEPDPRSFEMLQLNLTNCPHSNWRIGNYAIGAGGETTTFYMHNNPLCSGANLHRNKESPTVELTMEALDSFAVERIPNVIKLTWRGMRNLSSRG